MAHWKIYLKDGTVLEDKRYKKKFHYHNEFILFTENDLRNVLMEIADSEVARMEKVEK